MVNQVSEKPRTVGPVTAGAGGGVALASVICWILYEFAGIDVPTAIQGSFSLLLGLAGGFLVKPSKQGRYEA